MPPILRLLFKVEVILVYIKIYLISKSHAKFSVTKKILGKLFASMNHCFLSTNRTHTS